ncbi:MAG: CRISPR system precrRNA processing endoribonuclease RAMP protein Cas6 [Desulfatibacillaceae bacterium]|nr:CRISPR system precrRNA processing endoribonuclease RAMP protein Cas6 [Desulfatibacillaceae bacterium]
MMGNLQNTGKDFDPEPCVDQKDYLPVEFLSHFKFVNLALHCTAQTEIFLPDYSGSTFRGLFGHALKGLVCAARNTQCPSCPIAGRCTYTAVFEVMQRKDLAIYRNVTDPPRPFVLSPPVGTQVRPGEKFTVGLTVFGNAVQHIPWLIQAFIRAGGIGLGRAMGLFDVFLVEETGSRKPVYYDEKLQALPLGNFAAQMPLPRLNKTVSMVFDTPLRIKSNGSVTSQIGFSDIARHLMRRIAQISAFHCDYLLDTDFAGAVRSAEKVLTTKHDLRWYGFKRWSNRQKKSMTLGGVVGSISFAGDIKPFQRLLALGEMCHVGKGATFGLGRYQIIQEGQ